MTTTTVTSTTETQAPTPNHPYVEAFNRNAVGSSTAIQSGSSALHRSISVADNASLESGGTSQPNDPLLLQNLKKNEEDIKLIRKNGGSRRVQKFYREQNSLIDEMLGPLNPESAEDEEKRLLKLKIAVYGSVIANIALFALQLAAALLSGSLSIFATMADAFMDLLSSAVLLWATRQAARPNLMKYPAGKARMETAGIIVFACLMTCVAIFLIIESAQKLASGGHEPNLDIRSIAFVATALGTKAVLYLYCRSLASHQSARVLAQDHRNDILVNSLGLLTGILGSKLAGWVDPAGCILIALIIMRSWIATLIENIQLIVGKSADVAFLQRATYIALTHPGVTAVDTCRAYYAGNNLFVEVDIVLPPEMPLRETHDIGEALQIKLESLPSVERAFVHVDYEVSHKPEHSKNV
ncbi:cation efflux family-domain-containing protein [Umbelopsis sp. AD052]|nr:cation efflux family-domain-containing protein [Umbelopsis sp. AD052]